MCRSIKTRRKGEELATRAEIEAAALQFVRKVSGFRQPSRKNEAAFSGAVQEIGDSAQKLLDALVTPAASA